MAYNTIAEIGEFTLASQNFSFVNGNPCNILTEDNILMLCDDIHVSGTATAGTIIGHVSNPNTMAPADVIRIPCIRHTDTGTSSTIILRLTALGNLITSSTVTDARICMNGVCVHLNSKYYTPTIGNIYNNGTSPLDAR